MAWLDIRFGGVPLTLPFSVPWVGDSVFYPFFFLPMYIAVRVFYGRTMRSFGFYRRILSWSKHGSDTQMVPFMELLTPAKEGEPARPLDPASEEQENSAK